jgi:hypothetical protein
VKLGRFFKRLLIAIGIGFLILCLFVIGTFVFVLYYPQLGRISGFQVFHSSVSLEDTNYVLDVVGNRIQLNNTETQSTFVTPTGFDPDNPMQYTVLRHDGNIYLIVGGEHRGGNIGGYWFDIYNITNEPYSLQEDHAGFSWLSCTFPRLDGDALEFETAHQCDLYPLFVCERSAYLYRTAKIAYSSSL